MMEFIHEPFEHPFEHPFHHHHHEVNPIELAQIGGASQYAKLSYRLQKHIEDDTRHITDEERYKWNKTYNDLKALKEDIEDGVVAGGISINDVRDYLESMNYATKTWVNEQGFLKDFDVQQLINLYLQNRGILTKDDLNSALKDYIKLKGYLGTIDGQPFYQGDAITTKSGNGGGLSWSDIISGLSYNAYVNESTYGAQAIGEVRANGQSLFTIYQTDFGGDGISQLPIATTSVLGGIKAGAPYSTSMANATRYGVQVSDSGVASVVIPNSQGGGGGDTAGDVYNWNPFFTLYPSNKSNDKPQLPNPTTGTWSYGSYTWTDQAPNGNDDYFVWMCLVEYKNSTPTGNVNGPVCLGADPGADANGMEFVYRRWYTESAADVVGNLHAGTTNAGKTPADEDYVPSDWTDHPTGIDKDMRYEYMAYRTSTLINNKRTWSNNFSEPFLWAKWGKDGTDGDGIEFIFSSAVDLTTTQNTMKTSLTNALTQVFGSNYTANDTYQTANEVANVVVSGKSLDSLGWHDNAPQIALGQCVYVSIRKKRWDSNEEEVRWGEFSDPVIWSGISSNTSIIEGGTLYYLTVTPTQVHVDANGVKDADKIYARLYRSDENGTTEMTPTSAPNKYIIRYQFSNQLAEPTPFDNSAYTANGYELTLTDASSVTISATNLDGIQLCQAVTVSQIVDGSIVYGANAIDVNVLNDVLSIGADSENYVMRNISGEEVTVHAFIGGDSIIGNCTIKYNNTTLRSGNTSTVVAQSNTTSNSFNVSVTPTYSSNEITLKLTTRLSTSLQIDSSYSIPLQLSYTEDGQYYTRLFDIKINRINSGAKGVAPTLIRLLVNRDTIYYRENDFYDTRTITGKIEYTNSDGEWKVYNSSTPRPAGLPLFILRTVGIDGSSNAQSASQFSLSGDTWTLTAASRPSQLFNLYGTQFLILAVGQLDNSIIYDQETVNFIKEGKDGTNGTNGSQGLQGCVIRESLIDDGTSDTIYRNDSNWSTTSQIRYIDVVGVPSSTNYANEDGFEWFVVKPSESVGSRMIHYTTTQIAGLSAANALKTYVTSHHSAATAVLLYFEVLSNVGGIYSSFILAKNAKIKFQTSNELTIVGRDNSTIVAGLTGGGNSSNNVRIWAGTTESDVNNAPFRVYEDGSLVATKADIKGSITTAQGNIYLGSQEDAPQWAQLDSENFDIIAIKDDNDRITFRAGGSEVEPQVVNDFAEDGGGHVANGKLSWTSNGFISIGSSTNALFIDPDDSKITIGSYTINNNTPSVGNNKLSVNSDGIEWNKSILNGSGNGFVGADGASFKQLGGGVKVASVDITPSSIQVSNANGPVVGMTPSGFVAYNGNTANTGYTGTLTFGGYTITINKGIVTNVQ